MIHDGRHCLDIINQAGAVVSSIRRVQGDMLRDGSVAKFRQRTKNGWLQSQSGGDSEQFAEEFYLSEHIAHC